MEQKQQSNKRKKKIRVNYQHKVSIVDIDEIAEKMIGKTIEDVTVTYGEDTITIFLSNGMSIEIICDSIYADIPEFDD